MGTAATVEKPPASAYRLVESLTTPTALSEDGTVEMILIRPCVGKGRGRHLYEAAMLEENASVFSGWKMYANHQSAAARRALGGLPRPVEELAGRIIESKWDPDVPAEGRFGQGAVVGTVKPVGVVKKLIEEDPGLLEASIRATAKDVRPGNVDGESVWIVEGIEPTGTVDFVSEGGAGGRIKDLAEAALAELEHDITEVFEGLTDEEVTAYLRDKRPNLLTEAENKENEMPLDRKELVEALRDPDESEVREVLTELIEAATTEKVDELVESKLETEREYIRAEARADADRQIALRDMRDEAHKLIEAAELPDSWKDGLKDRYALTEGRPSEALDQVDEVNDDGDVTKPAMTSLREAVEEDLKAEAKKLAEANPTRVNGQGPGGGEGGEDGGENEPPKEKPYYAEFLEEAGVDPNQAYGTAPAAA